MNTSSNTVWLVNATKEDIINYAKHEDISNRDKITNITHAIEVLEEYPNTLVLKQNGYDLYENDKKMAMILSNETSEFVSLHEFLLKCDYWYKKEMLDK